MKNVFVKLVVLLSLTAAAVGLKCYSCNDSPEHKEGCDDPFNKVGAMTEDCPPMIFGRATCWKFEAEYGGQSMIRRACGVAPLDDGCHEKDVGGIKGTVCVCSSDLCNGSQALDIGMVITLLSAIAAIVLQCNNI